MASSVTGGDTTDNIATDSNYVVIERYRTVSSSGFGGGLSGCEAGATPGDTASTNPPRRL